MVLNPRTFLPLICAAAAVFCPMPVGFAAAPSGQVNVPAEYEPSTPTQPPPLAHGDTATIGYWRNKNGQALINSVNGSIATWLATSFPNLFGTGAGPNNLTGATNAQVAAFYVTLFKSESPKVHAQVMSLALAVYVTDSSLAGTVATQYGFTDVNSTGGTGAVTANVGSDGDAVGYPNNTTLTVKQILQGSNTQAAGLNGGLHNPTATNDLYNKINQSGDIAG